MIRFSTILLAAIPGISSAATLTVGPAQPYATISDAILAASNGDVIEVEAGDYPETLAINVDVEIVGLGGLATTSLSGVGAPAVAVDGAIARLTGFTINPTADRGVVVRNGAEFTGTDLDISGFSIDAYNAGAAVLADASMVTLVDVVMDGNDGGGDAGAAAFFDSVGSFTRVTVTRSTAGADGAVGVYASDLFIEDSTFEDNVAADDGGAFDIDLGSAVIFTTSTFADNSAIDAGGAITAQQGVDLVLIDCTFDGNVASDGPGSNSSGGAVRVRFTSNLTMSGTTFTNNTAEGDGGAIRLEDGNHDLSGNTFTDNASVAELGGAIAAAAGADVTSDGDTFDDNNADLGGAFYLTDEGDADFTNAVFTGNIATSRGGAIRWNPNSPDGSLNLAFSSFDGNIAGTTGGAVAVNNFGGGGSSPFTSIANVFTNNASTESGGAIYLSAMGDIYAEANTFCANDATLEGGAAFVDGGATTNHEWYGNLFIDNVSADDGGGLAFDDADQPQVVNNTFAGNSGANGGHISSANGTNPDLWNNIFSDAPAGDGVQQSNTGGSRDYNLWFNNTSSDVGGALNNGDLGGNAVFADPQFIAYSADGDCSNDDFHVDPASPAVDGGDPGLDDRDGSPSDIGAYGGPNGQPNDADGDGFNELVDCDDNDAAVNPDAAEICDGIDNNCNGETDLASAAGAVPWYTDGDGDGFGDINSEVLACYDPGGMIPDGGDCDDANVDIGPNMPELCDGIDQDCDGLVDDGVTIAWYDDADGDGFGGGTIVLFNCYGAAGLVEGGEDCDDTNGDIHPDATEVCDAADNNCDGDIDEGLQDTWYEDADDDGFGIWDSTVMDCDEVDGFSLEAGDCNDDDETIYPGADEVEGDAIDQDCDGVADGANDGVNSGGGGKGKDDGGCGCDSSTGSPGWLVLLAGLLAVRRRGSTIR